MDLTTLTDADLERSQKLVFERHLRMMNGTWPIAIASLVGAILLIAGVVEILIGGLMHGRSWLVLPGAFGLWLHYWEKGKIKENSVFLIKLGEEIKRREKT